MVSQFVGQFTALACYSTYFVLAAAEQTKTPFERLDQVNRTKVIMAFLALVLVGAGLVLLTIVGGRHVRKLARHMPGKTRDHEDDWYRKPLFPRDDAHGPHDPQ